MSETHMPVAEVTGGDERELVAYELAFHVLPTVAEGEVPAVVDAIKTILTKHAATLDTEEAPQRIELAYDVEKYLEGRHRKFKSAYFGWIRFAVSPSELHGITEALDTTKEILRYLVVKLNKAEAAHPFYYHEAMNTKRIETIGDEDEDVVVEEADDAVEEAAAEVEAEEEKTVDGQA